MPAFDQFDLTSRKGPTNVRNVQRVGKGSIFLIAVITWSWPGTVSPMIWLLLGLASGLYLVMQGSRDLVFTTGLRSRIGNKLAQNSPLWFPPLAFWAQQLYIVFAILAIWLTVEKLGFEADWKEHASILFLTAVGLSKRFVGSLIAAHPSRPKYVLNEVLLAAIVITVTSMAVDLIYMFYPPSYDSNMNYTILLTWIVATLVVLGQLIITLSRILQRNPQQS